MMPKQAGSADVLGEMLADECEPGGATTRQLIREIQQLGGTVVGADVVELNPRQDPHELTATVAAKLVKELAARMLHVG